MGVAEWRRLSNPDVSRPSIRHDMQTLTKIHHGALRSGAARWRLKHRARDAVDLSAQRAATTSQHRTRLIRQPLADRLNRPSSFRRRIARDVARILQFRAYPEHLDERASIRTWVSHLLSVNSSVHVQYSAATRIEHPSSRRINTRP